MIYYNYDSFKRDVQSLTHMCCVFEADTILAIARGGMSLGHALSMSLNIRNLQSIRCESYDDSTQRNTVSIIGKCDLSQSKRVLIVDDIVDSGKTLKTLIPMLQKRYPNVIFSTATIFTKSTALIQPDVSLHEALDWIDFFWERDFLKSDSL